ncbi:hypothetical protein V5799_021333 [Amblyomma americanum]|uniref:Uncharacterized protein n=1 Tax=Amblyomma americanum TaxID=6943 RepID=A0AAQ4FNL4_AMBAM
MNRAGTRLLHPRLPTPHTKRAHAASSRVDMGITRLLKFKRKNRYKKAALAAPRHFCTKAVVIRLRWLRRCAFRHPKMTTESTLSGSASPDCGDQQDPYQVLDDLRHAAMENVARQQLAIKQETERLRRELNELRRGTGECGQLLPVQPEDVEKLAEEIQESFVCGTADAYKIEGDLHEAYIVCKIVRQRAQSILKDVAEVNEICDNLANFSADSDDDEEPGGAEGRIIQHPVEVGCAVSVLTPGQVLG